VRKIEAYRLRRGLDVMSWRSSEASNAWFLCVLGGNVERFARERVVD
jgi:hypothetical protein